MDGSTSYACFFMLLAPVKVDLAVVFSPHLTFCSSFSYVESSRSLGLSVFSSCMLVPVAHTVAFLPELPLMGISRAGMWPSRPREATYYKRSTCPRVATCASWAASLYAVAASPLVVVLVFRFLRACT